MAFLDAAGNTCVLSDTNNSTTPLAAAATFTGTGELNDYVDVMVVLSTDQNGTLYVEFSQDNVNWDSSLSFAYDTARINPPHVLVKGYRYFRVRFTNTSASPQTYLRLQTYFGAFNKLTSPLNGTLAENYDAISTRPTNYFNEIAMGKRQGKSIVNKFGYNTDIDTTNEEIIASFGGTFDPTVNIITTAQTITITYDNTTDGLGQTGATQLLITYLDANFLEQNAIHVLSNTGSDVTSFTCLGVNRVLVYANGGAGVNTNDITLTATTDATIQAMIPALKSVTQQLIFHTQINHNLLLKNLNFTSLKLTGGGGSPRVNIKGFSWSRVTLTAYQVFDFELDTSVVNFINLAYESPFIFGGREVIYFIANTDTNNTKISGRFAGTQERVV